MALSRRAAIATSLGLAACGGTPEEPPPPPAGPPSYSHLLPLRLAVGRIEVVGATEPNATRTMPPVPLVPADVVRTMAQDRLQAAGGPGSARFRIQIATLTREVSSGGMFSAASERLSCIMRCRLEILGEDGSQVGFVDAEARRGLVAAASNQAERARSAESIVRAAGDALNVEFEFQVRRNLRSLLRAPETPGAAPPAEGAPATPGEPVPTIVPAPAT